MRAAYWIFRRELHAHLRAPIVFLVGGLFLAVQGIAFAGLVGELSNPLRPAPLGTLLEAQLSGTLLTWVLSLVVLALLGMRAIAEDKRGGAWELALTAQASERAIVIGKWAAASALYALLWLPTLAYLGVVAHFRADAGGFDVRQVAIGYAGAIAVGAALLAWVIAASATTSSTLVAGALGFGALVVVFLAGELPALWPGLGADHPRIAAAVALISPRAHLAALARGEVRLATLIAIAGCAAVGLAVATTIACLGRRRAREVRVRAASALALAVIVAAGATFAARHAVAWDASRGRRNSLDPETRALAEALPAGGRVTIIAPTLGGLAPIYAEVDRVVEQIAAAAPAGALAIAHADPATAPGGLAAVAREAGLQPADLASGGAVAVEVGGRRAVVDVFALATVDRPDGGAVVVEQLAIEQAIAGAISRLEQTEPVVACATTGHGELPLERAAGDQDWAIVAARLVASGVAVEVLPAGFRAVPARCATVIVAGPTTPLSPEEALAIQAHVDADRGLVVLAASRPVAGAASTLAATGLEGVLARDALGLPPAIAIDPDATVREIPGAIVVLDGYGPVPEPARPEPHEHERRFDPDDQVNGGAAVAIDDGFAKRRATIWFQPRAVTVGGDAEVLVRASPASWGERDLTRAPAKDADDLAGPVTLAAAAAVRRVIAVGSAESFSSAVLEGGASAGDLWLARAVRWSARAKEPAVSVGTRAAQQVRLVMTDGERKTVIALCAGGIPLAWLALGGAIVLLRRRAARPAPAKPKRDDLPEGARAKRDRAPADGQPERDRAGSNRDDTPEDGQPERDGASSKRDDTPEDGQPERDGAREGERR